MSLKNYDFKFHYNSDEDDIVNDFYKVAIKEAIFYKRAAGFFSSSSFVLIADGLKEFLNNKGKIQLIISPNLSIDDIEAIKFGYKAKEQVVEQHLLDNLLFDEIYEDQYNLLAWLIYENKLEIKIVIRKDFSNYGIFHDKFGIIYGQEEKISFHGSMNESETALINNFESFDVFLSWQERDLIRIEKAEDIFNSIWDNRSSKWTSIDIPESVKREVIKLRKNEKPFTSRNGDTEQLLIPENICLRKYQNDAIKAWIKNNCKGILEMATGSGKTFTAICGIIKLLNYMRIKEIFCGLVIVVPYKNLLEQWCDELKLFNINPIRCYESKNIWYDKITLDILDFNRGISKKLFIITTNSTFISESFQESLKKITRNYIFCADEMHHLFGGTISGLLPENADFKIGLTATMPKNSYSNSYERVMNFFENGVVYRFTLKDAIENKFLTPYYYYPVFVELADYEKEEYYELSKRISKLYNIDENSEILKSLISKRSRIIFNAENKIEKLKEYGDIIKQSENLLVYCGDKSDENGRYVDNVNRILAFEFGIRTHTFTSKESKRDRERILKMFKNGDLQCLTAIKCLDEGVNIPRLEKAFILASNNDEKQFVQRRGRILRKAEGKEYAVIYDFIVIPTLKNDEVRKLDKDEYELEKKIIFKEIHRFNEFAELAINRIDAYQELVKILKLYDK